MQKKYDKQVKTRLLAATPSAFFFNLDELHLFFMILEILTNIAPSHGRVIFRKPLYGGLDGCWLDGTRSNDGRGRTRWYGYPTRRPYFADTF